MFKEVSQKNMNYRFLSFLLVVLLLISAGCKTNLLNRADTTSTQNQPQTPPAPIVVNGVRVSYADVGRKNFSGGCSN
jgi:hypothetical protein